MACYSNSSWVVRSGSLIYSGGSTALPPMRPGRGSSWPLRSYCCLDLMIFGVHRTIVAGIPATILLAAAVSLEQSGHIPGVRILKYLGDASYSFYLTHLSAIVLLRTLWTVAKLPTNGLPSALVFVALSFMMAVLAGSATYSLIEMPMLRYLRRRVGLSRGGARYADKTGDGVPVR
jgi:exopolysaccharide production protein ExoZ